MDYKVERRTVPQRHLAVVKQRISVPEMGEKLGQAFGSVMAYLGARGTQPAGMPIAYYQPVNENTFDVSAGFPVDSAIDGDGHVTGLELPACEVAFTTHIGAYDELPKAYDAILSWIRANGREEAAANTMWEEYWSGPEKPASETRTDIYWPLKSE